MFLLFLVAQAAAAQPAEPASKADVKPKQICEYKVVTGSRGKRKVCKDENGHVDFGPGVWSSASNSGMLRAAPSGSGETAGQGLTPQ